MKEKDLAWKFWDKYYHTDMLDKEKVLEPIMKRFEDLARIYGLDSKKFPKKYKRNTLFIFLMDYFDDLINYMETRKRKK